MRYFRDNGLFICYCIILGYMVFIYGIRDHMTEEVRDYTFNLMPFVNTFNDISFLINKGFKGHMNLVSNTLGNIILFIPFSFLLLYKKVYSKIGSIRIVWIGIATSVCIEFLQYVFLLGVTDIDDVLLNAIGLLVGAALAKRFQYNALNR